MEEINNEEKKLDTEEIKKETVEAAKQVTETIKNVDLKNDAKAAKGFVSAMFKDPFAKIKEIVEDKENKNLKMAIIFIIVWTVAVFIKALSLKYWSFSAVFRNVLSLVKTIIAPVLGILVLSGIVYVMNKKEKKSILSLVTSITIAKVPTILASVLSLLTIIGSGVSRITSPISSLCSIITTILTYFTIKEIMKEEDNSKFIKTFVIVEAIYYVAYVVIGLFGIYI